MSGQKPRQIAAQVLQQWRNTNDFAENLLDRALDHAQLSSADRGLCHELIYGVLRWRSTLDWLIEQKTPGRTQKPALRDILRLGLYQIFWLDRVPPHAAVHETVELARHNGFGPQAGFVNAVLRGYVREAEATQKALHDLKQTQPAIGYSHPEWLVQRWQNRWGNEKTAALLNWNNTPPKNFARLNSLRTDAARLIAQWREENVKYDFKNWDWTGENLVFELKNHPPLTRLESFQQGWFYIQDPSTLLSVRELDPRPGEAILDLCAAPGGKTTFAAQLLGNRGRILAQDLSSDRLRRVEENCQRLGVTCVKISPARENHPAHFDKVLLDAPCSNTGVMRRRVDLRWRIQPAEIERLRATQTELLNQAANALKSGGKLIYSTCSLEPEENQQLVREFLKTHAHFELLNERELLPFVDGVDGAYVTTLRRK